MEDKLVKPPFEPKFKNKTDCRYFDDTILREDVDIE